MKKSSILLLVLLLACLPATAQQRGMRSGGGPGPGAGLGLWMDIDRDLAAFGDDVGLSDAQRSELQKLIAELRTQHGPHLAELRAMQSEVTAAREAGDRTAMRAAMEKYSATRELMAPVLETFRDGVHGLLSDEQREKLAARAPRRGMRRLPGR